MLAADFALGEALWSLLVIFLWITWFWLLIVVIGDLFRDHETSGWAKALWMIFMVFLPYLGVFVYLIARGDGMAARNAQQASEARAAMDDYVRETAGSGGAAAEIAHAKKLLDDGAISQEEFEALKAKALS
jgi:hypothetical protein